MPADMTDWDQQVIQRFKTLLNVSEISADTDPATAAGEDNEAKLKRAAIARNLHPDKARTAHEALTTLAFSGYGDWYAYDDDDWIRNCLGQIFDRDQNAVLVPALENAVLTELEDAIERMADTYASVWQEAAENEAAEFGIAVTAAGLFPAENTESWKYSRTPGTRYYIFHEDEYLYSDDQNAPLAGWATAEARDNEAAHRATEWETGSGVFYTSYENPALVGNLTHVFGRSKDGPWILTRAQAAVLLDQARRSTADSGVAGAGSPVEPYYDTGHFTKYQNDVYYFGETADTATWYPTYQELLSALTTPAATVGAQRESSARRVREVMDDYGFPEGLLTDKQIDDFDIEQTFANLIELGAPE